MISPSPPRFQALASALAVNLVHAAPTFERRAFTLPQDIWGVDALDADGDRKRDLVAVGESALVKSQDQQIESNARHVKFYTALAYQIHSQKETLILRI